MSKHGATKKKRIKSHQSGQSSQTSSQNHSRSQALSSASSITTRPIIQRVSLEQALSNPQNSSLPPEVGAIFGQMKDLESRAMRFINAAKLHDTQKRAELVSSFIAENEVFIKSKIESLVNTTRIYFLQNHEIPYQLINQRLQQIQSGEIESNLEKQTELFNTKIKESEYLFLLGYEKISVWQTIISLLETYAPDNSKLRQQCMMHMFEDLTQSTSYLINRFMLCKLHSLDYYHCHVYLKEKANWLMTYGEEYQSYLQAMPCETESEKKLVWMRTCDLLQCYQSTVSYLYSSQTIKEADALNQMAKSFLAQSYEARERFVSPILSIEVIDDLYKVHQEKYEHMAQIADSTLHDAWLQFLGTLSFFYEKDWGAAVSVSGFSDEPYDTQQLCKEIENCKSTVAELAQSPLPLLTMRLRSALAIFSQYKGLPSEAKTKPAIQAYFNLSIELYKIACARTFKNVFYHQVVVAIFKLLADEMGNELKKMLVQPAKAEVVPQQSQMIVSSPKPGLSALSSFSALMAETEEDTHFDAFIDSIADELGDLILDDPSSVRTNFLESEEKHGTATKSTESDASCSYASTSSSQPLLTKEEISFRKSQEIALKDHASALEMKHSSELSSMEDMHHLAMESLRAEYAQKLLAETKRMEALHESKKTQMQKAHQEEKAKLSHSLDQEYQKRIQGLTTEHKSALEKEQVKHEKSIATFKSKKKKQYDKKIQALLKSQELEIQAIKDTHEQVINQLQQQHQKSITAQEASLALELKKITEELSVGKNSSILQLKKAHEQKLKEMAEHHAITIRSLRESNQRMLKAHQDKCQKQLQKKSESLEQKQSTALSQLKSEHEEYLRLITVQHEEAIRELEISHGVAHEQAILQEKAQQHAQSSALIASQNLEYIAHEQALSTPKPLATDGLMPFAHITLPDETVHIVKELKAAGIEYYFSGGFVRNRLLGIPLSVHEDIDIIVNCNPSELPPNIKSGFTHELLEPRKLKLGKIDLWCDPWDRLEDKLKQRDLSINTFICKDDGSVYDLLNKKQDLYAPYLCLLGDTEERFTHDPSLMMRLIRFSQQLCKSIAPNDWKMILKHAEKIKSLDIGIYLKNIEYLFISPYGNQNLDLLLKGQLLPQVCPLLNMTDMLALQQNPTLLNFVTQKLHEFSLAPENYGYYYVLAVFALIPMSQFPPEVTPQERLHCSLDAFFANYTGSCEFAEKNKIQKIVASLMFDVADLQEHATYQFRGMLSQYNQFAEHCYYNTQKMQRIQRRQTAQMPSTSSSHDTGSSYEEVTQAALEEWPALTPLSRSQSSTHNDRQRQKQKRTKETKTKETRSADSKYKY